MYRDSLLPSLTRPPKRGTLPSKQFVLRNDVRPTALYEAAWVVFEYLEVVMLIVMDAHATPEQVERVCEEVRAMGYQPHPMPGRTGDCGHGRSVHDRGPRPAFRGGAHRDRAWCDRAAWWSLQATHLAVQFSGTRGRGTQISCRGSSRVRYAGRHRGNGYRDGRPGGRVRRYHPDRRAQHAELRTAEAGRANPQAGSTQARTGCDRQG